MSLLEYENLKDKIFLKLRKDFDELQDIYNNNFKVRKNKFFQSWYRKIGLGMIKFCIFLTCLFYFGVFVLLSINWLNKTISQNTNDKAFGIIFGAWFIIVITTSVIGGICGLIYGADKLTNILRRFKKHYSSQEYVEKTGDYYCRICKKEYKLYKYSRFPSCQEHSFKQDIIGIFKLYNWALCDDKYYQMIKGKDSKNKIREKENIEQNEVIYDTDQAEKSKQCK